MSLTPITELLVPYDPGPLTEKVARRRALVRSRIFSLVITVAVLVAIYFWQRDQLQGNGFLIVYGVVVGIPKRAPLLVQERITYAGDRVIEHSTSWYRADRYRIHMAITPRGAQET